MDQAVDRPAGFCQVKPSQLCLVEGDVHLLQFLDDHTVIPAVDNASYDMTFPFELANEMQGDEFEAGNIGTTDKDQDLLFIQWSLYFFSFLIYSSCRRFPPIQSDRHA